ncbi:Xaa-Pro dipeptidyl-peptidase [Longispora albida]|uniref:Xaa-Pro dipeptidyl-peptidase n=1 Tax=Longispora albida TaxID=203523 RepID=UPI0003736394|nr:Xaa-Pro dipeptidyl-peptidase [Longispora albida]
MRLVLVAAMAGSVLAVAAPAHAAPGLLVEERVYVESAVDSDRDGRLDRIALDISRPSGTAKVPVIFEHSPYRSGGNNVPNYGVNVSQLPQEALFGLPGGPADGPALVKPDLPGWLDDYFVPRGYAVVLGHSLGTGPSDGCPTSGDQQETLATKAVIDWLNGRARGFNSSGGLVTASWSTGAVGMTGVSYNGTLPNMVATTGVPGLKTIVPVAAISSWYDYYRANGLVVAPGGYQGEDADVLAKYVDTGPRNCSAQVAEITAAQGRSTGDFTQFWRDRDYVPLASQVKASVFVVHGLNDWNVKTGQFAQWWDALGSAGVPRKLWLHQGGHGNPSRSTYQSTLARWFEYWLKGVDNGIMREPIADVQRESGSWATYSSWPQGTPVTYYPSSTGALNRTPGTSSVQSFTDQGRTIRAGTLAASPAASNPNRLAYLTPALSTPARLSGTATAELRIALPSRKAANITALLVDYSSSGSPAIVTRGWIDPQNRTSASTSEAVVPGTYYTVRFNLQAKDYVFAAGRQIGLVVISTDYDYTLRPNGGTVVNVDPGASRLTLPLV